MARGFLSGVIWGGIVSVAGAGVVSVLSEGPMRPNVVDEAPIGAVAPGAVDTTTADAVTDADLVRDGAARPVTSPTADDVQAASAAGADTPLVPETGAAEDLSGPAIGLDAGGVAVDDEAPVLPSPQAVLPSAPDTDGVLSISTDPAQPPAPEVPQTETAFAEEAQTPQEADVALPASDVPPAVTDVAAPEPEVPAVPEAPEDDVAVLLPSTVDPAPSVDDGPTIGRRAISLVDRTPDVPTGETPETPAADLPPIEAFAAPFENPEDKPLMSIVLLDSGVDLTGGPVGLAALRSFPYPLSFAVDASLSDAAARMADYRAQGFEVMVLIDLPQGATASDAEVSLSAALDAVPEAVGVIEGVGTGIQESRDASDQITEALKASGHGLVLQSKGLNTAQKLALREGVPTGLIFRDFDSADQTPSVIRRFLDQAAFRAGQEGGVIMVGRVRPDTISALLLWGLADRAERVALAPISAVLKTSGTAQ
mmetsp:Transcript_22880/g.38288  ORF Transcript_22880/g.38288 Transcript_22880/m.38288 type:complete len:482 (+) Transcript_22880:111-1556(+)